MTTVTQTTTVTQVVVWAGTYKDATGRPPPPSSYASLRDNDVAIFFITLQAGGEVTLPAAAGGSATNRVAYFVEGDAVGVNGE